MRSTTHHIFLAAWGMLILLVMPGLPGHSQVTTGWKDKLLRYIDSNLSKKDGGYGWEDQPDAHVTPTFAAIGILKNIDHLPADRDMLIEFVTTQHPQRGKNREAGPSGTEMRDLTYQQIQSLLWLQADVQSFEKEVVAWKPQSNKVSNFEQHGYPVFIQEMMTPVCRSLLAIPPAEVAAHYTAYIEARKRLNGSFNNAPVTNGGDGNILNTYWGLYAWRLLHKDYVEKDKQIVWVRSCQLQSGAFTYQPQPFIEDDGEVVYTWAGVKALQLLSASPSDKKACINYLLSLRNADGGFGNRPGLPSTPMSTFYAIDALKTLNALTSLDTSRRINNVTRPVEDLSGLKVFSAQFQAHGTGSPAEAVKLASLLGIHLWGCENTQLAWMREAQKIAKEKKVPVTFFYADEANGKVVKVDGLGAFTHIQDYIAPATKEKTRLFDGSSWRRYRDSFVEPLLKDNGALILQVTNNEPLARMILDESVKKGGYAAISTIHFGQNFLFWLPFLYQYRFQLPFISLQDAHGTESWWWTKELTAHRTLFLASEATYDGLMNALKNNWVVAVRHDSLSNYKTRLLGGANGVQQYMLSRQHEWAWWKDDAKPFNYPYGIITVVAPRDTFEVAHPRKGVNIRIRCWWDGVRQTITKPAVTLEQLTVDNKVIKPEYVEVKDRRGMVTDSYYLHSMPAPSDGNHSIKATFRNLRYNSVKEISETFIYEAGNLKK